ncbi:sugar kinase [Roseibium alexandrii]|uniref:Sugar kinase, ribokinase family n=1 Tax=Roseibium alexandrii (strain DSM 17067 / NCIMB 14079 / DFL-11) TaxID=244592 RepID=A0A5E8H2B3_ROSAD|nr:sugar kinase [Roseibium alexandrii]EEE46077.2 Sugar kinase, ribokinase family [Roseibium alexandrii DFL-11]
MPSTFLAIGECMVEMAPTGEGTFAKGFAGDTLNTAWYVRKSLSQDWAVSYLTAVGNDQISEEMIAFLDGAGLATDHIQRLNDRTIGLYLIQLKEGERSFAYWRSQSAARCLADDAVALSTAMDTAGLIYFSGITLGILSPEGRQTFLSSLAAARQKGARAAFDPNLRSRLWEDAQTMRDCVTEAAGLCDFVMPSFEDEEAHFGDKIPSESADRYLAAGAKMIVVKNGPQEVIVASENDRRSFRPDPVRNVVDTTAAGDSFNAAFLAEYLVSGDVDASVAAGARLAGTVIQHRGALLECRELA